MLPAPAGVVAAHASHATHSSSSSRPCMQPLHHQRVPQRVQPPLSLTAGSSNRWPTRQQHHQQLTHSRTSPIAHAKQPDRGSVAALEAAIGAINGILGAHNSRKAKQQQPPGTSAGAGKAAAAGGRGKTTPGPSKLISFGAKASGSVPVKEWFKIRDEPAEGSTQHHQHHRNSSSSSKQPPLKPPAASEWPRSLQSYLSLPLEQYSVLDPSLVTRLPPGTDTELLLQKLLVARKEKREAKAAAAAAAKQQQQQQEEEAAGSGTSLEPTMRELQQQAGIIDSNSSSDSSSGGASEASSPPPASARTSPAATNGTSSSSSHGAHSELEAVEPAAAAPAAPAAAATEAAPLDAGEAGGSFLLRIPMEELVGIALEPLLIITVDIDPVHGQVKFRASRLVVGDERFDSEFKVDLQAVMSSKVNKQPHTVHAGAEHSPMPAAAAAAGSGGSLPSSSSDGGSGAAVAVATAATAVAAAPSSADSAAQQSQQQEGAAEPALEPQQEQPAQALFWQRTSGLSCKVNLSMTLRLPYPLSIVPGPLLSTTAGLVAKLVMQSLLPSFLELLATDYGRWATGSSRAPPVGSLLAAGKQHLSKKKG